MVAPPTAQNGGAPSLHTCPAQMDSLCDFCKDSRAWPSSRKLTNQPERQSAVKYRRGSSRCLRLPTKSHLLLITFVLLMAAKAPHIPHRRHEDCQTPSPSWWTAGADPLPPFYQVLAWLPNGSMNEFGLVFASAALCAVNICNTGTCYEHGTAQVCVCPLPFKGPTCAEKASLCVDDCGIRTNSGLDCQSALCSLGTCVDTDVSPYFKCECGDFFQGTNCEVPSNPCTGAVNPCGQGTCVFAPGKGTGTVTCQCHDDWEVAQGVGVVTTKWGNSEVVMNPPCSVRVSRGLANIPFTLSSGELVFWWTVFATALCFLLWCCYTVAAESCGSCFRKFKIAGQVQKAAGA
ncbi:uncharacterized protein EMH_0075350 [Eimeria mitis]|uniref:EGF-like domain-containing protein n=1 Tax=Eimeria mitis TaxID=44415 RepID=U6KFV2_9EIME|nr:uncharacterized protein EMH_0075350 [Eimeria mitis]CDJ36900.1 hypothetical protein, conserved [Eimeria mitis]